MGMSEVPLLATPSSDPLPHGFNYLNKYLHKLPLPSPISTKTVQPVFFLIILRLMGNHLFRAIRGSRGP